MKGKPNVDKFLSGADKKAAERDTKAVALGVSGKRAKKVFELPEDLVIEVERRCTDERAIRGRRVTQREVVEALLRKWVQGEIAV